MTTALLPAKTHGVGETESFRLVDDSRQLVSLKKETHVLVHGTTANNARDHIASYIAMIRPSTTLERDGRLRGIGLHRLADAEKIARRIELISYVYPELVDESYNLWDKFLPTKSGLGNFAYDSIPDEALGYIESAQAMGCFDRIMIWSPEGNDLKGRLGQRIDAMADEFSRALETSLDPMAVGIVNDQNGTTHFYSIVRWGESLQPVEQIAKYVKKVDAQEAWVGVATTLLALIIVAAVVVGIVALAIVTHFVSLVVMGVIGFVLFLGWLVTRI